MKFSVAPESRSASTSALLDAACTYVRMVMDFLNDKYTRSSIPLLIQAAQIRAFKNPTPEFEEWGRRRLGVPFLYLQSIVRRLVLVCLRLGLGGLELAK